MNYIYVLKSIKNQKRYIGSTRILPSERCNQHNLGWNKWTKGNGPFDLIYQEEFASYSEAKKRENFLKSGVGRKFLDGLLGRDRVSAGGGSAFG